MDETTVSGILAHALKLAPLPSRPQACPETLCALGNCGRRITEGYPRHVLTTEATNEFLDTFHGNLHGLVCEDCARCFKANNSHGGNEMARAHWAWGDGTYWAPLISRESAAKTGRPCWSDLAREAWQTRRGQRCVIVLTTDTKKRLWPGVRVATLGEQTPVLFYDSGSAASSTLVLDWPRLLTCLDAIEGTYALGFTKKSIQLSLFAQFLLAHQRSLAESKARDRALARLRALPEFQVALLIAQRPLDYVAPTKPARRKATAPAPVLRPTATRARRRYRDRAN